MDASLKALVNRIVETEKVSPEDVVALRKSWLNASIGQAEAEAIFAINKVAKKNCPQWVEFFAEAICACVIEQAEPTGCIDDAKAKWLIKQIGTEGELDTRAELLLLIAILEKAEWVSRELKLYAIEQVERTVLTGKGPTRLGSTVRKNVIDDSEVALLRRILFAPGSDGATVISEAEATLLFRLKDATCAEANSADWPVLFVQLVGNHFMAQPLSHELSIQEATRLDAFMNDNIPNITKFLGRLEDAFLHPSKAWQSPTTPGVGYDEKDAASHSMTVDEANCLKRLIVADNDIDDIERTLLAYIIDEAGPIPAAAAQLAKRA